jgi:membrane fusion protein, multidrug efflux system
MSQTSSEARPRVGWRPCMRVGAIALVLLALGCGGSGTRTQPQATVAAATFVVAPATRPSTRAVAGTARAANVSELSAAVVGNVARVHVAEGDRVRRGEVLIEIDPREARAQSAAADAGVAAARADAELAEVTFRRFLALQEHHAASRQELDVARARRDAAAGEAARAAAAAEQARAALAYRVVRAPSDGVVVERFVDPGAQAAPGVPLLRLEDAARGRVDAEVPASWSVAIGDRVGLDWGSGAGPGEGRVARIQPSLDAVTRSSHVQIELPASVRSGTYVRVLLSGPEQRVLVVPSSAVIERGSLTSVYVVGTDRVARQRLVTLGEGGEVLSGLEPGERVVIDATRVHDGVRVE